MTNMILMYTDPRGKTICGLSSDESMWDVVQAAYFDLRLDEEAFEQFKHDYDDLLNFEDEDDDYNIMDQLIEDGGYGQYVLQRFMQDEPWGVYKCVE